MPFHHVNEHNFQSYEGKRNGWTAEEKLEGLALVIELIEDNLRGPGILEKIYKLMRDEDKKVSTHRS